MTDEKRQDYAMKMVVDGVEKKITFEELALSNNLSQQALVALLIKKGIFTGQEILDEITRVRTEQYRSEEK